MSTSKGVLATRRFWLVYLATATLLLLLFTVALASSRWPQRPPSPPPPQPPGRHLSHAREDVSTNTTISTSKTPMKAAPTPTPTGHCVVVNCSVSVTCNNVDDVASELGSCELNCPGPWKVNITSCRFSGDVLGRGWLPSAVGKVREVYLTRCSIATFADDAFQGPQFNDTRTLVVETAAATSLSRATLAPLVSLDRLELRDFRSLATVEDGALSQLLNLEELQLQLMSSASPEFWTNTTGGRNVLGKVKTLDLSMNDVGDLREEFLSGVAVSAEQIFLMSANVKSLQGGVFGWNFETIRDIHLNNNHLTSIPNETVNPSVYMFLEGNPWDCSCPLEWVTQYRRQIRDAPECQTPLELKGRKVLSLNVEDVCRNGSATSPPPSSSTSTSTPPPDYTSLDPTTSPLIPTPQPPTSSVCVQRTPKEEQDEVASASSGVDFTLTEVNSYAVRLQVSPRFLNGTVVWVTYDNGSLVCFQYGPIRTASLVIEGLSPETSYAFCFSSSAQTTGNGRGDPRRRFDPVDCVAHKTSALYENQSWIPNNKKNLVLGVGSASAITTCVVIALGVFCALRRNPKLISKNVIVVKEFKDHILVMPKNYVPAADRKRPSRESSSTASTTTTSSGGVSTVQQHKKLRKKPPVKPRIASPPPMVDPVVLKSARVGVGGSHNPTPRSSVSYVSVQEPTGAQKVGWRLRKAKHRIRTFFKGKPYNKLHNTEIFLEATQPKSSYTLV